MDLKVRHKPNEILYVLPALVFVCLFTYYPIVQLLRISFTDWNLLSDAYEYIGLDNYRWLVEGTGSRYFWGSVGVTVLYAICEVMITVFGGLLLALVFRNAIKPLERLKLIVLMPRYVSMSCAAIVFLWMFNNDYGVVNQLITLLGGGRIDWLGNRITAFISLVIVSAWRNIGYGMIMYLASMACIPREYYEIAQMDRASSINTFFYVTLPQILPTMEFLALTTFLTSIKNFQSVDIMTGGGPMRSTEMIVYLIYRYAMIDFRMGRAAASAMILFVFMVCSTTLFVFLGKRLRRAWGYTEL